MCEDALSEQFDEPFVVATVVVVEVVVLGGVYLATSV